MNSSGSEVLWVAPSLGFLFQGNGEPLKELRREETSEI